MYYVQSLWEADCLAYQDLPFWKTKLGDHFIGRRWRKAVNTVRSTLCVIKHYQCNILAMFVIKMIQEISLKKFLVHKILFSKPLPSISWRNPNSFHNFFKTKERANIRSLYYFKWTLEIILASVGIAEHFDSSSLGYRENQECQPYPRFAFPRQFACLKLHQENEANA